MGIKVGAVLPNVRDRPPLSLGAKFFTGTRCLLARYRHADRLLIPRAIFTILGGANPLTIGSHGVSRQCRDSRSAA
ncbi:hypothetical protein HYPGJ_30328 [Hyphomicrobium sp. GJ21]|nr:hypothetical protein HYPGJ_30328 [Hyphomicrobium sp. GJ21]